MVSSIFRRSHIESMAAGHRIATWYTVGAAIVDDSVHALAREHLQMGGRGYGTAGNASSTCANRASGMSPWTEY